MTPKKIIALAAADENNVIGYQNKLPWCCPEDLKFFKEMTVGKTVLMGRRTAESLGRPLPNRQNIVLSRMWPELPKGFKIIGAVEDALHHAWEADSDLVVIGGAQIYRVMEPHVKELYLTRIPGGHEGDTHFPMDAYDLRNRFTQEIHRLLTPDVAVYKYTRCGVRVSTMRYDPIHVMMGLPVQFD